MTKIFEVYLVDSLKPLNVKIRFESVMVSTDVKSVLRSETSARPAKW